MPPGLCRRVQKGLVGRVNQGIGQCRRVQKGEKSGRRVQKIAKGADGKFQDDNVLDGNGNLYFGM